MPRRVDSVGSSYQVLGSALDDYLRTPGKYQVRLRQPAILFEELRDVLQVAVGRDAIPASDQSGDAPSLQEAARFFIRTALLYPDAEHYTVLGLHQKATGAELKERYRLMMRLLHPDFSGPDAQAWPKDAAVRVNRAYDVLSSPVQRREYDERLAGNDGTASAHTAPGRRPEIASHGPAREARRERYKTLAAVCAVAGAALVVLSVISTETSDTGHLVQRSRGMPSPEKSTLDRVLQLASPDPDVSAQTQTPPWSRPAPIPRPPTQSTQKFVRSSEVSTARPTAVPEPVMERTVPSPLSHRISPALPSVSTPEPRPDILADASPIAVKAPILSAPLVASAAPIQVSVSQRASPKPGPTLIEAQPLLSQLLQLLESGRGERILNLLDAEARNKPSAQALSRSYDLLVDGARPVRLSHVEFKAEPGDGKLMVVGQFRVVTGEQTIGSLGKKMVLRAEFVSRDGNVTISGLSGGPGN